MPVQVWMLIGLMLVFPAAAWLALVIARHGGRRDRQ